MKDKRQRNHSLGFSWWTWPGSNRRPPACKAGALPAELHAHIYQMQLYDN